MSQPTNRGTTGRRRVIFQLSMPGVGSWNGRWSGEGKHFALVRTLPAAKAHELDGGYFTHVWDDGWRAAITARIMKKGERVGPTDGFLGYGWMVDNIIRHGSTYNEEKGRGEEP